MVNGNGQVPAGLPPAADRYQAPASQAVLKELTEQNIALQQRAIANAARAGVAEARVAELQAELEQTRRDLQTTATQLHELRISQPSPPADEGETARSDPQ